MSFPNANKPIQDLLFSFIVIVIFSGLSYILGMMFLIDINQLSLFITLFLAIMGVLITILTLLFAFEDTFSNNPAIKILKAGKNYNQIYKRFIDSSFGLLYSIIVLSVIYIFFNKEFIQSYLIYVSIISYILIFFCFFRIYRAFYLFKIYHRLISSSKK